MSSFTGYITLPLLWLAILSWLMEALRSMNQLGYHSECPRETLRVWPRWDVICSRTRTRQQVRAKGQHLELYQVHFVHIFLELTLGIYIKVMYVSCSVRLKAQIPVCNIALRLNNHVKVICASIKLYFCECE